mmetsp:Transcript_66876/g.192251  ORF Transcript_66876/g.192251 Transcript_66876/m.192251 type:complete len:81 (+) Transcript_66876:172-414(+)
MPPPRDLRPNLRTSSVIPPMYRNPKVLLVVAACSAVCTITYALSIRGIEKERMYRGVTFDVERMNKKAKEGIEHSPNQGK